MQHDAAAHGGGVTGHRIEDQGSEVPVPASPAAMAAGRQARRDDVRPKGRAGEHCGFPWARATRALTVARIRIGPIIVRPSPDKATARPQSLRARGTAMTKTLMVWLDGFLRTKYRA